MKATNFYIWVVLCLLFIGISGCTTNNIVDTNEELPQRNWSYVNRVKAIAEITDPAKAYILKFKLRHTSDYRYSNIFILVHMSGPGMKKVTRRYEYRLAESDGQWLGKGSGNLFTYTLPLFSSYHFPQAGKYTIEIEQNMRDNPLREVSDVGIVVAQPTK